MCGEHKVEPEDADEHGGSSPHVRGTLMYIDAVLSPGGIIPACAGNTAVQSEGRRESGDHPRMCGEHGHVVLTDAEETGSSPHVRGTPSATVDRIDSPGIIPACAGNTLNFMLWYAMAGDHPRMCGEHSPRRSTVRLRPGSSPHVRGTPRVENVDAVRLGIIPACAGNTVEPSEGNSPLQDHPRMCGEHASPAVSTASTAGSSPHVRGTPGSARQEMSFIGIIPACAGNTRWSGSR